MTRTGASGTRTVDMIGCLSVHSVESCTLLTDSNVASLVETSTHCRACYCLHIFVTFSLVSKRKPPTSTRRPQLNDAPPGAQHSLGIRHECRRERWAGVGFLVWSCRQMHAPVCKSASARSRGGGGGRRRPRRAAVRVSHTAHPTPLLVLDGDLLPGTDAPRA